MMSTVMKEQRDIIARVIDSVPERDQRVRKAEEPLALPNVMAALSNRIEKFIFDPDADMSFAKWFSRYKEVFSEDAKQLSENNKLEKSDAEDYLTYTGRVNEFCEKAKIHELDSDGIKCLLWIFGLKSQQEAEIRQRLIAILDREHKAGRSVSLHELHKECENFLSLRRDSEIVAGYTKTVEAAIVEKRNEIECFNCEGNHYARQCKSKLWFCKKCRKTGHKEKFCDILRRKKPVVQDETTKKVWKRNREAKGGRKAPRRQVRTVEIANAAIEADCPRVYIDAVVNNCDVRFLLDTGSDITLLNENTWKKMGSPVLERTNIVVKNASGENMKIYGKLKCQIKMKGVETKGYAYVTPYNSLIGLEWIRANEEMKYHLEMMTAEVKMSSMVKIEEELEKTYPGVFEKGLGRCTKEQVDLQLNPNVRPVFCNSRPVPHAALEAVNAELDRLVQINVIEPVSHSEWAAPIVCVKKQNGKLRICADFSTGLNRALQSYDYPLPIPEDIFASLNGGTIFSQIDLSDAYLQLELSEESKKKVVINTHKGLFRYNRLPFGIKTAPGIFQQVMNKMVTGLQGVATYLDDILVSGRNEQEHRENLLAVFRRIADYGFKIRLDKCTFARPEIQYLGFILDKNGRRPNPEKIKAIKNMDEPKNIVQLRSFLGMITYYSVFVPTMKTLRGPLDALLRKDVKWRWTSKEHEAFEKLKTALSSDANLAHYDPQQKIVVAADACDYGIGCVISHRYEDGSEKPIAHASRSLSDAEKKYSQIEKEALGLVFAVKKFHKYLFGRKFLLLTDHKPLLAIFGDKKGVPVYSANRLMRWATILLGYDFDIEYVKTTQFGQVDGLSRLMQKHNVSDEDVVVAAVENDVSRLLKDCIRRLPLTHEHIRDSTAKDSLLKNVKACVKSGKWSKVNSKLSPFFNRRETLSIVDGCLMMAERVVVPEELQSRVLKELHAGHPGIVRMKKLARSYVYWPNLDKDCEELVRNCSRCQEYAKNPIKAPLEAWSTPAYVWQRIHIDFAGPVFGLFYLVVVDSYSKWPEIIEMTSISASQTVKELKKMFARYGIPQTIVSDNGTQFTSEQFRMMCEEGGITHVKIAPYHPQSNGQAERFVDTLKRGIKKLKGEEKPSEETLNVILQAYRTTPNDCLNNSTPAEVFLGRKLRTRLSLLCPMEMSLTPPSEESRKKMIEQFNRRNNAVPKEFEIGQAVYAQVWRAPKFIWKEGIITRRIGKVNYEVDLSGRITRKHANQLRRRDTKSPPSYGDKSLLTLLETLELDDEWKRREETTQTTDAAALGRREQEVEVPLRRSKRIRRPVQRYPDTSR
nr:RNA-directed DNA polymerase (reverse transcriptase) and Integrase domain containing protein [Haemonchus contortus]